jgi:hypothetical protein
VTCPAGITASANNSVWLPIPHPAPGFPEETAGSGLLKEQLALSSLIDIGFFRMRLCAWLLLFLFPCEHYLQGLSCYSPDLPSASTSMGGSYQGNTVWQRSGVAVMKMMGRNLKCFRSKNIIARQVFRLTRTTGLRMTNAC